MGEDEKKVLTRLGEISEFEFQRNRKKLADELKLPVGYLDKLFRHSNPSPDTGDGRFLTFEEIVLTGEPVNGTHLLDDLTYSVSRYVILPESGAEITALWTVFSWAHDCFHVSPILAVQSPQKGSGKTTYLDWLQRVVPRSLPASHATTSSIFRIIEKHQPTLLIDEADAFLKDNEEMRGLLNSGWQRTCARVIRTADTGKGYDVKAFSSWAPKCIAGIGHLPDTLQDRSLILMLQRKRPGEEVERLRAGTDKEYFHDLQQRCAGFAAQHDEELRAYDPKVPEGLSNRQADNWAPLIAIADLAGGHWPATIRRIAENRIGGGDQDDRTILLKDIQQAFLETESERLSTAIIIDRICDNDESPWSEWKAGKPITPRQLATLLKPYGIHSETLWFGKAQAKGYRICSFTESWERYLSSTPDSIVTRVPNGHNSLQVDELQEYAYGTGTEKKGTEECQGTQEKGNSTAISTETTAPNSFNSK